MPTSSPGDVPAETVAELGLPGRAVTALTRAGVTSVADLAVLARRELAAIDGLGPGMIAAIRRVVPEPPRGVPGTGTSSGAGEPAAPAADPAEEESPAAPAIPSFQSLRNPRHRSAVDLLVPEAPPAPPAPATAQAAPRGGPRPAEYADLLRLGVRVVRTVAGLPVRMARWSVREPSRCLRRLLGD